AAKEPRPHVTPDHSALYRRAMAAAGDRLGAAYGIRAKAERRDAVGAVKSEVVGALVEAGSDDPSLKQTVSEVFKKLEADVVRGQILDKGERIDGRDLKT